MCTFDSSIVLAEMAYVEKKQKLCTLPCIYDIKISTKLYSKGPNDIVKAQPAHSRERTQVHVCHPTVDCSPKYTVVQPKKTCAGAKLSLFLVRSNGGAFVSCRICTLD